MIEKHIKKMESTIFIKNLKKYPELRQKLIHQIYRKMKNQTALITGASSGIGFELAKIMASKNFNLVLIARQIEKLNKLKKELEEKNKINVPGNRKRSFACCSTG